MPKKVRPGSKRLPPWQTPQTQCRGSYSRKMSKKGVFEQAKDTFSHGAPVRHAASPPRRADSETYQPILGLDTAPRPLRLMVCACLDRPWSLLPAEPRVRPLVGHFRLAPKGT